MDIDILHQLADLAAVAGRERMQADLIRRLIAPYTDETRVDRLGSVIARERSKSGKGPRVVFEAPMSSPGYLANDFRENGLVCLSPLGHVDRAASLYTRVVFSGGAKGVIVPDSVVDGVAADIGALDASSARDIVRLGEWAVYEPFVTELVGGYMSGWPLSSAAGCAALIETAKKLSDPDCDVWFVFAAQRMNGGSRGASAALYDLLEDDGEVDYAFEIGCAPELRDDRRTGGGSAVSGLGPCVKLKDGRSVCDPDLARRMQDIAGRAGLKHQLYIGSGSPSDVLAMQTAGFGARAGGIIIPVRNYGLPAEIVSRGDIESASKLAAELVKALGEDG